VTARPTPAQLLSDPPDSAHAADGQAYALVEEARLRCEQLQAEVSRDPKRHALRAIHRQLGMAGWAASTELPPHRRQAVLRDAHHQSVRPMRHPVPEHALTEVVIEAEDALAAGLGHDQQSEHLHLARAHLLHAMDLLHAYLYG
jgi:Tfp pilus assembly protein PilW